MLSFACISPHPPIIIPTIGRPEDLKKVSQTIRAMERLAQILAKAEPQTLLVISPHGPMSYEKFIINSAPILVGSFNQFGDFDTEMIFRNDEKLIEIIEKECQKAKIPLETMSLPQLDHGSLVPLYYLFKGLSSEKTRIGDLRKAQFLKVVTIIPSFAKPKAHFQFGKTLQKVLNRPLMPVKYGVVASGDLSHRLTPEAPAGFSPKGKKFDEKLIELLRRKDAESVLNMDSDLLEEAGECAYRSIVILLGALDASNWQPDILSYEGPFGVGYLVANFKLI